jgi:hypothetical protein
MDELAERVALGGTNVESAAESVRHGLRVHIESSYSMVVAWMGSAVGGFLQEPLCSHMATRDRLKLSGNGSLCYLRTGASRQRVCFQTKTGTDPSRAGMEAGNAAGIPLCTHKHKPPQALSG